MRESAGCCEPPTFTRVQWSQIVTSASYVCTGGREWV